MKEALPWCVHVRDMFFYNTQGLIHYLIVAVLGHGTKADTPAAAAASLAMSGEGILGLIIVGC